MYLGLLWQWQRLLIHANHSGSESVAASSAQCRMNAQPETIRSMSSGTSAYVTGDETCGLGIIRDSSSSDRSGTLNSLALTCLAGSYLKFNVSGTLRMRAISVQCMSPLARCAMSLFAEDTSAFSSSVAAGLSSLRYA